MDGTLSWNNLIYQADQALIRARQAHLSVSLACAVEALRDGREQPDAGLSSGPHGITGMATEEGNGDVGDGGGGDFPRCGRRPSLRLRPQKPFRKDGDRSDAAESIGGADDSGGGGAVQGRPTRSLSQVITGELALTSPQSDRFVLSFPTGVPPHPDIGDEKGEGAVAEGCQQPALEDGGDDAAESDGAGGRSDGCVIKSRASSQQDSLCTDPFPDDDSWKMDVDIDESPKMDNSHDADKPMITAEDYSHPFPAAADASATGVIGPLPVTSSRLVLRPKLSSHPPPRNSAPAGGYRGCAPRREPTPPPAPPIYSSASSSASNSPEDVLPSMPPPPRRVMSAPRLAQRPSLAMEDDGGADCAAVDPIGLSLVVERPSSCEPPQLLPSNACSSRRSSRRRSPLSSRRSSACHEEQDDEVGEMVEIPPSFSQQSSESQAHQLQVSLSCSQHSHLSLSQHSTDSFLLEDPMIQDNHDLSSPPLDLSQRSAGRFSASSISRAAAAAARFGIHGRSDSVTSEMMEYMDLSRSNRSASEEIDFSYRSAAQSVSELSESNFRTPDPEAERVQRRNQLRRRFQGFPFWKGGRDLEAPTEAHTASSPALNTAEGAHEQLGPPILPSGTGAQEGGSGSALLLPRLGSSALHFEASPPPSFDSVTIGCGHNGEILAAGGHQCSAGSNQSRSGTKSSSSASGGPARSAVASFFHQVVLGADGGTSSSGEFDVAKEEYGELNHIATETHPGSTQEVQPTPPPPPSRSPPLMAPPPPKPHNG